MARRKLFVTCKNCGREVTVHWGLIDAGKIVCNHCHYDWITDSETNMEIFGVTHGNVVKQHAMKEVI